MMLKEATFEAFKYEVFELKPQSGKPILAACDDCGKVRETSKDQYRALCPSCVKKSNKNCIGHIHTEETRALISKNHADFKVTLCANCHRELDWDNGSFGICGKGSLGSGKYVERDG